MIQTSMISRNKSIPTSNIGSELGMLNESTGKYYVMNEIGSYLWELIEEPKTYEDIVKSMLLEYDVDEDLCSSDLDKYIGELADKGIVILEAV